MVAVESVMHVEERRSVVLRTHGLCITLAVGDDEIQRLADFVAEPETYMATSSCLGFDSIQISYEEDLASVSGEPCGCPFSFTEKAPVLFNAIRAALD